MFKICSAYCQIIYLMQSRHTLIRTFFPMLNVLCAVFSVPYCIVYMHGVSQSIQNKFPGNQCFYNVNLSKGIIDSGLVSLC